MSEFQHPTSAAVMNAGSYLKNGTAGQRICVVAKEGELRYPNPPLSRSVRLVQIVT